MTAAPRTVVIGGGIAGAAVALALRARGAPATVVERARDGRATAASAGMLAPLYEAPRPDPLMRLGLAGLERWPAFAERLERLSGRSAHLRRDGLLVACLDAEEEKSSAAAAGRLREAGLEAELLEPDAARETEPAVGEAHAWLWLPREAHVDAQELAGLLPGALLAAGARLLAGSEAVALRTRGPRATGVRLDDGETLEAERVVLAAGAWSAELEGLPRQLPVRPLRGQMIRYAPPAGRLRRVVADHAGRYVVPRDDGSALAGSTMEEAGFETRVTEEGLERIRARARRLVPALRDAPEAAAWAGLRPMSPDGRPILGPDPAIEGLLHATAYGRNGILIAPAAGEAVAALALGEEPPLDLEPFRPDRFG